MDRAPLRPTLVNEARFGAANFYAPTTYETGGLPTVNSLGLKGLSPDAPILPPIPRITFTGGDAFTQLKYGGDPNFGMAALLQTSRTYTLGDTMTRAHGKHTVEAGLEWRRTSLPSLQQTNARGSLSFVGSSGRKLQSLRLCGFSHGDPQRVFTKTVISTVDLLQNQIATFFEDSWRITDRLTLDLGLRHELPFNPTEAEKRLAIFDQSIGGIVVASDNGQLPTNQYPQRSSQSSPIAAAVPVPSDQRQGGGLSWPQHLADAH
ncbi:MAG: hypothetical protein ACJ746_03530 [Bryobacteraceae bacterium]